MAPPLHRQRPCWRRHISFLSMESVRRLSPILAPATVITTLVTCLVIAKVNHRYTGTLVWPYFSDLGRDDPGYYVFVVGLTLTAIFLVAIWYFNFVFHARTLRLPIQDGALSPWLLRRSGLVSTLGILSVVGLPVLAICSTTSYPSVHSNAAYWFFILEALAVLINTSITYRIYKWRDHHPTPILECSAIATSRKHTHVQATFCAVFLIAFALYIPIGLAVVCDFAHLSTQECLALDLGEAYCTGTMHGSDPQWTKLWDYSHCRGSNQMRSGAQLGCIVTLVGYSVSFLLHKMPPAMPATDACEASPSHIQATRFTIATDPVEE
ncbi:Aste57867_1964 [Aphanomyces stellatus]|uniref:Aste57867_1964 protein n=1 Tax=Aphanomyces stellatus TaxID=120398 RepID=A0A485K6D4_9STRA|nr:hypothetical protein As57867_001962 [Aphanomyces stellatus]VFT79169.1 Aste57867_1964 [Aphanomyces stellatus]